MSLIAFPLDPARRLLPGAPGHFLYPLPGSEQMNRKDTFNEIARRILTDTLGESEIEALQEPLAKLMLWAYTKGIDAGIQAAETELKNAV